MTTSQLQCEFCEHLALLVLHIRDSGYRCKQGEAFRSDEQAEINAIGQTGRLKVASLVLGEFPQLATKLMNNGKNNGVRASVHQLSLAQDLHLFKDGVYLSATEDHRQFGEWWEKQHPLARWGGRWGDGNHYSFEFQGVK